MATKNFNLLARLQADISDFQSKMGDAARTMGNFDKDTGQAMQNLGSAMTGVGKTLTTAVTLPIVGFGAAAVKVGAEFEKSMSKVQALSGATGDELKQLEDKAREMGATTRYSASESANALGYMSLAGWNTQQMIAGLPPVLDLATAGQLELAQASDIVTKQNWSVTEKLVA